MGTLRIDFNESCLFVERPGRDVQALFVRVAHHTCWLVCQPIGSGGAPEKLPLDGCRVDVRLDGQPLAAGATDWVGHPIVDLGMIAPGVRVRREVQRPEASVPEWLLAGCTVTGGAICADTSRKSRKFLWDVPRVGRMYLADRASWSLQHTAAEVTLTVTGPTGEVVVERPLSPADAVVTMFVEDTPFPGPEPGPGDELEEFTLLYTPAVLPGQYEKRRLLPRLHSVEPEFRLWSGHRPVCNNGRIVVLDEP